MSNSFASRIGNKLLSKNENYITILNLLGTLIYQGINFLLTPYLTRALDTANYGMVTVYTSWVNVLVPIIGLTSLAVIPHIKLQIKKEDHKDYLSSLLGLSLVSFVVIFLLSLLMMPLLVKSMQFSSTVIVLLLLQSFGMAIVNFAVAYCVQYQKTIFQFGINIGLSIVTCVLSIWFIQMIGDESARYMGRIIGYSVPNFLIAILIYGIFLSKSKRLFEVKVWKFALPICLPIILHSLSSVVLSQCSRIMVQKMDGFDAAGVFGFIYNIASLISVLWVSLNNAWVPIYYKMLDEKKYDLIYTRAQRYMFFFTCIFCGFILVSPEILKIMGDKAYYSGIPTMPIISLGMYFIFLYSFAVNFKTINKKTASIAIGTVTSAIVNIVCNFLLVPIWGIWGAAAATLIAYIVLFLFHEFTVKEVLYKYGFTMKFFIKGIIPAVAAIAAFYLAYEWWIVRWLLALCVGILLLWKLYKQRCIF